MNRSIHLKALLIYSSMFLEVPLTFVHDCKVAQRLLRCRESSSSSSSTARFIFASLNSNTSISCLRIRYKLFNFYNELAIFKSVSYEPCTVLSTIMLCLYHSAVSIWYCRSSCTDARLWRDYEMSKSTSTCT